MPGYVYHVVDTAHDPEIAVFVAPGSVAREVHILDFAPVLTLVALRVTIDRAHHRGPRTLHYQKTALVVSNGIAQPINDIGHDAGERFSRRTGLRRHGSGNGRDH